MKLSPMFVFVKRPVSGGSGTLSSLKPTSSVIVKETDWYSLLEIISPIGLDKLKVGRAVYDLPLAVAVDHDIVF